MTRTRFGAVSRRIRQEKSPKYIGAVNVRLDDLCFPYSRGPEQKNVKRLIKLFQGQRGCNPGEPQNRIPAIISETELQSALATSNLSREDLVAGGESFARLDMLSASQLECLRGEDRAQAAREVLNSPEPRWVVDLYAADISDETRRDLAEEYACEQAPADGDFYFKIREYQGVFGQENPRAEDTWKARLGATSGSGHKKNRMDQIVTDPRLCVAFDAFSRIPVLYGDLKLSLVNKMTSMGCYEESLHYLNHIKDFWHSVFDGNESAMIKLDRGSLEALQQKAPGACEEHARDLYARVRSGEILGAFNEAERERIWSNIHEATVDCTVPSLYGFFEDRKYIEDAAYCMKRLFPPGRHNTIRSAQEQAFPEVDDQGTECLVQVSSSSFKMVATDGTDYFDLAYRQLWLYARRHFGRLRNASARELRDHFPQHLFLEYSLAEWENHAIANSATLVRWLATESVKAPTLRDAWLLRTAKEGNETVVRQLLRYGASMAADMDNMTPMHYAVSRSSKELAQCLLDAEVYVDVSVKRQAWQRLDQVTDGSQDAPVQEESQRGLTALHYSALIGCPQMTEFLLQQEANPNAASEFGETPLHLAVKRDLAGARWPAFSDRWNDSTYRVEDILELIEYDPEDEDDREYRRVQNIVEEHRADVLTLLLGDTRTDVNARDDDGATALHSVRYGSSTSSDIVKKLIQRGAKTSARNNRDQTPLHLACSKGDASSIITFLVHSADIGATDYSGVNCLHYATKSRNANCILRLLTDDSASYTGALPLAVSRDLNGRNALHHLFIGGKPVDETAVQRLLELGAKCNELDNDGMSPLAYYLSVFLRGANNAAEVVRLLLHGGSDTKFKTRTGGLNLAHLHAKSAIQVQVRIFRMLARFEVDLQATDDDARSILHRCAICGSLTKEAFEFLRSEVGLTVTMKDTYSKNALDYATAMKQKPRPPGTFLGGRWSWTEDILLGIM